MSPLEGRSLVRGGILLLALSVIRLGVDGMGTADPLVGREGDDLSRLLEETREARDEVSRRTRPLAPGETVDPNRSGEEELDRLPGVGPAVAGALVRERMEGGGYAEARDLLRVRGIGPATLERIEAHLDFSQGIPLDLRPQGGKAHLGQVGNGPEPERGLPGVGGLEQATSLPRVNINRASAEELQTLAGIGPVLAERILRSRAEDGPFRAAEDLLRVQGIGPATLARLRSRIFTGG